MSDTVWQIQPLPHLKPLLINLTFHLPVTNEEGVISEPDAMTETISPVSTHPPSEEPLTLKDLIKDLIKNPVDMTNSIKLTNKIIDILTDSNIDNDQMICGLFDCIENKQINNIREIINC